jgi:hypothetical protein
MHGDQQSLWPDPKSHGSRSNSKKLFAEKPAEVARIEQKFSALCADFISYLPHFLGAL